MLGGREKVIWTVRRKKVNGAGSYRLRKSNTPLVLMLHVSKLMSGLEIPDNQLSGPNNDRIADMFSCGIFTLFWGLVCGQQDRLDRFGIVVMIDCNQFIVLLVDLDSKISECLGELRANGEYLSQRVDYICLEFVRTTP